MMESGGGIEKSGERLRRARALWREERALEAEAALASCAGDDDEDGEDEASIADFAARVRARCDECRALLAATHVDDGAATAEPHGRPAGAPAAAPWTLCYRAKDDNTCVWHRPEAGGRFHSLRAQGVLHTDVETLGSLLYEVDLLPTLFPFVKHAEETQSVSLACKVCAVSFAAPWPLWTRHSALYGFASDALETHGCMLLFLRSARDGDVEGRGLPAPPARCVPMQMRIAGMRFEPLAPGLTRVTTVGNADPNLPHVPATIINWTARTIFRASLQMLERRAARFAALPHAARRRTEVHEWMRRRVAEYLAHAERASAPL